MPQVEQELLPFWSTLPFFCGVCFAQSLVLCVIVCPLIYWPLITLCYLQTFHTIVTSISPHANNFFEHVFHICISIIQSEYSKIGWMLQEPNSPLFMPYNPNPIKIDRKWQETYICFVSFSILLPGPVVFQQQWQELQDNDRL